MKKQLKAIIVCVICTSVFFTASAIAKEPGVLERAITVDDRELGELIRIAIENLQETNDLKRMSGRRLSGSGDKYAKAKNDYGKLLIELRGDEEKARVEVIRNVTEAYAQIKLLDTQIKQTRGKMGSISSSEAKYTELALAVAKLEAKRTTQLAQLRQIMNIVPKYAFGHKSAKTLNGWLVLDVIGDQVYTFKALRPFYESDTIKENPRYKRMSNTEIIKEMSKKEAVGYIKDYIKDKNKHPFRIDITKNTAGTKPSEELYDDIVRMIKAEKVELESVVYLHDNVHDMSWFHSYFTDREIYSRYERRSKSLYWGSEQEYIDEYFTLQLKDPKNLPLTHRIEFDEESEELANRVNNLFLLKAKELKVEKLIETKQVLRFDIYTDGPSKNSKIYFNQTDRKMKTNGIDYQSFVDQMICEHMKKAENLTIKYLFLDPNSSTFVNNLKDAIKAAAKEASVRNMVEIQ